jgi:2-polyprenyl-6-methoxyphenol hydroxylase-like FAD-dependent oxidoreductase
MSSLRVAIAGAGLGGLCLAQGLLRAGADVTVYERDAALAGRRQGYRLHVDARAGLALAACLPPDLLALFQATCGSPSRRLTVLSERLRVLHEQSSDNPAIDPYAPATLSTSVNRQTFREVLAAGLTDRLAFGHELSRYETSEHGVRLHFADGRQADADLLVGADGVNSAVCRQYLPAAEAADTGKRCIYGKTPLSPQVLDRMPAAMTEGFTAVVGGRIGMATGLVRLRQRPEQAAAMATAAAVAAGPAGAAATAAYHLSPAGDYLMWAVTGDREDLGVADAELGAMSPAALHALSANLIRTWHPDLRALHALADVDETFLVRVRTSVPVPGWPPSRVTVLGDAIHAMSPAGGSGANTALQDAALLCRMLTGVTANGTRAGHPGGAGASGAGAGGAGASGAAGGDGALIAAVGAYEEQMRGYGYAAVAASSRANVGAAQRGVMSWLYRRLARSPARRQLLLGHLLDGRAYGGHGRGQVRGAHGGRDDLTEAVVVEPGAHGHAVRGAAALFDAHGLAAERTRVDHVGTGELLHEAGDRGGRSGVGQMAADEHDDLLGVTARRVPGLVHRRDHVAGLARAHLDDVIAQLGHVGLALQVHRARVAADLGRRRHGVRGTAVRRELEFDDPGDRGPREDDDPAEG